MQALGWCYYQMRRFDDALKTYRSMLEAVPEFSYGLATYAWSLRHTGSMEEAVLNAEKALEFSSGGQLFVAGVGAAPWIAWNKCLHTVTCRRITWQ